MIPREDFDDLYENAPCGYFSFLPDGTIIRANQTLLTWLEFSKEELIQNKKVQDLLVVGAKIYYETHLNPLLQIQKSFSEINLDLVPKNQDPIPVLLNAKQVQTADGVINRAVAFQIQERRKYESELLIAQTQNREKAALLEQINDAVEVVDLEDRIIYWNKASERLFGFSQTEALGQICYELTRSSMTTEHFQKVCKQLFSTGHWEGECRQFNKDGTEILMNLKWTLGLDENQIPSRILKMGTDVTEQKRIERQMLRGQKKQLIGTLTAGVAHHLNNILAPALLISSHLKSKLDPSFASDFDKIEKNINRAKALIRQLVGFTASMHQQKQNLKVCDLLRETLLMAQSSFGKDIRVEMNCEPNLPTIFCNSTEIQEVFLNLMMNASDAMPSGGLMTVSASLLQADSRFSTLLADAQPGTYIRILVSDTGTGIRPEHLEHLFEPFFTTKSLGDGTGLGLSQSLSIVEAHHGFMDVISVYGKGSTFFIYLPVGAPGFE